MTWKNIFLSLNILSAGLMVSLSSLFLASLSVRAQTFEAANDIVEMEKFEVSASVYRWQLARVESFEILSNLKYESMASDIVQDALLIISALKKRSPLFRIECELPTKIILLNDHAIQRLVTTVNEREGMELRSRSRMQDQLLNDPQIQGATGTMYSPRQQISTVNKINHEQAQIVMYIPESYRGYASNYYAASMLVDAYIRLCLFEKNITPDNLTYMFSQPKMLALDSTERGMMRGYDTELLDADTVWFAKSRSRVEIRRYNFEREKIIFERLHPAHYKESMPAPPSPDAPASDLRRAPKSKLMPGPRLSLGDVLELPEKFRIDYAANNSGPMVEDYITYKRQISDFSIYCAFGPNERVRAGYLKLLGALKKQRLDETLFEKCIGMKYADFHDEMYAYYRDEGTDNYTGDANAWGISSITIPATKPPRPVFFTADRVDRARIFSEWFMACNAPHLAREYLLKAEAQFRYARKDPGFVAAQGIYEARAGDKAKARDLLERAITLKTTRPEAYRMLALLRGEEAMAKRGNGAPLSAAEIERVIRPIETALKNPRHHPKTYTSLIRAWYDTGTSPPTKNLQLLASACLKRPDDFTLLVAIVPLLKRAGMHEEAATVLEATSKCVLSQRESEIVRALSKDLPANLFSTPDST